MASAHRPIVANDLVYVAPVTVVVVSAPRTRGHLAVAHDVAGLEIIGCEMAQYGEWSRKGATLSHVTARKEYGVDEDFIVAGINAGKLEYREGAVHGNPYIRVLRRQLEAYIAEERGDDYLRSWQAKTELRDITREMAELRKRLDGLEARRAQIEGRD